MDHPWFSNELVPIYRWTFPSEATDDELAACLQAREELRTACCCSDLVLRVSCSCG